MIVYGTKAVKVAQETQVEKCTSCGSPHSVELYVFQKYAHLFWIPFFPLGKTGVSECGHCKQVLKLNEMPNNSLRDSYDRLKKQSSTPVWMFSGLALVAIIVTVGIINSRQQHAENVKLLADPRKGDIYEIRVSSSSYTAYKVSEVMGDTVLVMQNSFEVNKPSGLADLKKKPFDEELLVPFSKSELQKMLEEDKIMDVDRN